MSLKMGLLICLILIAQTSLKAATVSSVTENTVALLLDLEDDLKVGQKLFLGDFKSKKIGLIKITSIHGETASATLLKGKAVPGSHTQLVRAKTASSTNALIARNFWVFSVGLNRNSLQASDQQNETISLSGQGLSFGLSYESLLDAGLTARYGVDFNNFVVTNGQSTGQRDLKVGYLGLRGDLNYYMNSDFYTGMGLSFMNPARKTSSNLFSPDDIGSNMALIFDIGYWWHGELVSIPFTFQYFYFLGNSQLTTHMFGLQTGVAW